MQRERDLLKQQLAQAAGRKSQAGGYGGNDANRDGEETARAKRELAAAVVREVCSVSLLIPPVLDLLQHCRVGTADGELLRHGEVEMGYVPEQRRVCR